MVKTKSKTGSKVIVTCSICGKQLTRAGFVGHMRFKHGRDWKAPMMSVEKPLNLIEARSLLELRQRGLPLTPCCHAKFRFAGSQNPGDPLAGWKCESCGSIWHEKVMSVSEAEKSEDGKVSLRFEIGLERQP